MPARSTSELYRKRQFRFALQLLLGDRSRLEKARDSREGALGLFANVLRRHSGTSPQAADKFSVDTVNAMKKEIHMLERSVFGDKSPIKTQARGADVLRFDMTVWQQL